MKRKKFTLIELIAVIVILGIVSVVAIPKYVNMQKEAADATAQGVLGAAQSACALNYAKSAVGQAGHVAITTGQTLLDAMAGDVTGWTATDATIHNTINGVKYTITINPVEVATANNAVGTMAEVTLTP